MPARVIVLAGPSGSGKSRLAKRLGLPVLHLDDFYRDVDAPGLPRLTEGKNAGMVDWDDPRTWDLDRAMTALTTLSEGGTTEVPVYSIPESRAVGSHPFSIDGRTHFVAEGIFAPEVVERCREAGILQAAYCVRQHPWTTFWRRLQRDLRERRKPPLVLVRRGLALMRGQGRVVADAVAKGCTPALPDEAYTALAPVLDAARHT